MLLHFKAQDKQRNNWVKKNSNLGALQRPCKAYIWGQKSLTKLHKDLSPLCSCCYWSPPPSVSLPPFLHHHPARDRKQQKNSAPGFPFKY